MIVLLSPAKTLDFETACPTDKYSQLEFPKEAKKLNVLLKKLKVGDIQKLMSVSEDIAQLNHARFKNFQSEYTLENSKQAVFAFKGDVYLGMEPQSFSEKDLDYAQGKMRILSGLYGILRPLDLIQPYRLEMGTKLANKEGTNLYHFWGDKITKKINAELKSQNDDVILNLASNEYFKSVKSKSLQGSLVTAEFKDSKNGEYKMIGFFAKKARGAMAAYVVKNRIEKIDDLKGFDWDGYIYNENMSEENNLVFTRG